MLTPLDLHNKSFNKEFRGYATEEVDTFFSQLAKDYERLYQDNVELKNAVERVSAKLEYYKQMESTMQSTLNVAQETADEVKRGGEQRLQLLEQETAIACNQKRAEADAYSAKVKGDADTYVTRAHNEAEAYAAETRNAANTYAEKLKSDTTAFVERMKHIAEIEVAKLKVTSEDEANRLLSNAREESHKMVADATERSQQMIYNASEEAHRRLFEAETKASTVLNIYETQVKRLAMNRNTVVSFLEAQIENFKKFTGSSDDVSSLEEELNQIIATRRKLEQATKSAESALPKAPGAPAAVAPQAGTAYAEVDAAGVDLAAALTGAGAETVEVREMAGGEVPGETLTEAPPDEAQMAEYYTGDTIRLPEGAAMLARARGEEEP